MFETAAEVAEVQALLDRSFASSSEHLLSIMEPERRLTADEICRDIPSPAVLNIASVTKLGEPRVSAVDGHFLHGRWFFTTDAASPKARQLLARPAISASFTPRDGYGIFCHGTAVMLVDGDELDGLRAYLNDLYGQSMDELAEAIAYIRIDAHWMTAFSFDR